MSLSITEPLPIVELMESREKLGDSSFYVYDEELIRANIARFASFPYAHTSIHFASMANDNPVLLELLKEAGFGLFVNSRKHLQLGLSLGFRPEDIIFASTGINRSDAAAAGRDGHPGQHRLARPAARVRPSSTPGSRSASGSTSTRSPRTTCSSGLESRIGVLESEFDEIFAIAARVPAGAGRHPRLPRH